MRPAPRRRPVRRATVAVALAAVLVACATTPDPVLPDSSADQRLLVTLDGAERALTLPAGVRLERLTDHVAVVTGAVAPDTLAALPGVLDVEHDVQVVPATFDPGFPQQYTLRNVGQPVSGRTGVAGEDVRAEAAWQLGRGSGQVVALVDGAVDLTHPDLQDAFWTNPGEAADGTDGDGNGLVDDVHGWDFTSDSGQVGAEGREARHGTELAGAVAARADNGVGVAGLAPRARVMPVQVVADGVGLLSDAVAGLAYAAEQGADVAVLSWVGAEEVRALRTAVRDLRIPVVVPAGNGGTLLDDPVELPPVPNLLVVAALDNRGRVPGFTNRGRDGVDLMAPGWQVLTTTADAGYARVSGTSLAAAHVGAALALADAAAGGRLDGSALAELALRSSRAQDRWRDDAASSGGLDANTLVRRAAAEAAAGGCPPGATEDFPDVAERGVHATGIACVATVAVVEGFGDGLFRPEVPVRTEQAAAMVARLLRYLGVALPQDPPDAFVDDEGSVLEDDLDALAAAGLLDVPDDRRIRPLDPQDRASTAELVERAARYALGAGRLPSRDWFDDDDGLAQEPALELARDRGLLRGTGRTTVAPDRAVLRGEAASMLAALLDHVVRER